MPHELPHRPYSDRNGFMSRSWVIITDGYINSWSFVSLLREQPWQGNLVVLRRPGPDKSLMELWGDTIQLWTLDFEDPDELLPFLRKRIPESDPKALLFTDESLMPAVHRQHADPWLQNAAVFPGPECALETILDRLAFYHFIEGKGLGDVPRTIDSGADPFAAFPGGFFIRFKRSWSGLTRLPRPRLVESRGEFQSELKALTGAGWTADQWCYQEKLSIDPTDNISICGWHDARNPAYLATRKALQFPARQGGGAIVEAVQPPRSLFETARVLLDELRFEGPFELEFVREAGTPRYRIIELNPRLWMQHALHGATTGQTILRHYLGLNGPGETAMAPPVYWINGVVAMNRILCGSWDIWRYLLCKRKIVAPPWGVTLRWLPRFFPNLIRRTLSGWRR